MIKKGEEENYNYFVIGSRGLLLFNIEKDQLKL